MRRVLGSVVRSRGYSTPSSARPATVLPSSSTLHSRPAPPTPNPASPESFIPRPVSRSPPTISSLEAISPTSTVITFSSPQFPPVIVPHLFLRDASVHAAHVHPSSQQKLFQTSDISLTSKLVGYGVNDIDGHGICLITEWDDKVAGTNLAVVPVTTILKACSAQGSDARLPKVTPWNRAELLSTLLSEIPYGRLMSEDRTLLSSLDGLIKNGLIIVRDVPTNDTETLAKVVDRIGRLRKTWYGDLWDVKAVPGSKNIAYTNLDLGIHMDLTHFPSPPRYQFLHCLNNHKVTGGRSYFVDSYKVASLLSAPSYQTLASTPMHFHYNNGGQHTSFLRSTLELDPSTKELRAVNYSPPFQGPLPLSSYTPNLHSALQEFADLSKREENVWETQLHEGDLAVFDNRRVLHARTAFEVADGGARWLKGAYSEEEEVGSRWRVLREKLRGDKS